MDLRIDPAEQLNDEIHRRVAARIRCEPSVIAEARARLERWLAQDGPDPHPAWLEWETVLDMLDPIEVAEFLDSTTPRARRMRCSSPFFGLEA